MKIEPIDLSEARAALLRQRKAVNPKASVFSAGRVDRLTYDWAFKILSVNQELGLDQERIVGRSRQLAGSDPTMAKFLASVWKNVFGPDGIRLQSKVLLQRGGRPNETINKIIQDAWQRWGRKENCTLDQRLSWTQLQRTVSRVVATDGECFIRKVRTSANPFGFCLQIINSDRVDRTYGRNAPLVLSNGNLVFMGIECSADTGAVAAYHVFNRHPAEAGSGPRERFRIPAEEIIHIFLPIRDNQWRGIPWALPSMFRMNMLGGGMEAELVAARLAACQMGFVTQDADPNGTYTGAGAEDQIGDTGGLDIPVEAGMFGRLAPGESITQFKPEHPTTAFPAFIKESKLDIAAGLDLAYMTLTGDVDAANFSSARVGLLDERATWEGLQGFFIEELCQPIFSPWLRSAFLLYPGLSSFASDWRALDKAEWRARAFDWVDPLKDTEAMIAKWSNKMTTLHRVLASQGEDFEETIQEWADEQNRAKELGIDLTPIAKGGQAVLTENNPETAPPKAKVRSKPKEKSSPSLLTDLVMSVNKRK